MKFLFLIMTTIALASCHLWKTDSNIESSEGPAALTNKPAPLFELSNQDGTVFRLADRQNKGWTVLFFYPKAGTPGCTEQACAFRDSIKAIRVLGAEVYGLSGDTVEKQKKFHTEHALTYDLLADPEAKVIRQYGTKLLALDLSKRITFIIDDQLVIRRVFEDVDPALDAKIVAQAIQELKAGPATL